MSAAVTALPERLQAKITEAPDGCWHWTGARHPSGYGHVRHTGRVVPAHRLVYELLVGPIPTGLQIDHLCRVRYCVNPAHLEPVTQQENIARSTVGQPQRSRTHCPAGHPFDDANTHHYRGERRCRTCMAEKSRAAYLQLKATAR